MNIGILVLKTYLFCLISFIYFLYTVQRGYPLLVDLTILLIIWLWFSLPLSGTYKSMSIVNWQTTAKETMYTIVSGIVYSLKSPLSFRNKNILISWK